MWPFSRKPRDLSGLPAISDDTHKWGVAEAARDGAPLILRFNTTAQEWIAHPGLPIKLGFAVPLKSPSETGLPDPDENEALSAVEDIILREVEARARGINVLALTTGTMKEFVFYIAPGVDIQGMHETIQEAVATHEVQCMAVREPNWDSYRQFTPR